MKERIFAAIEEAMDLDEGSISAETKLCELDEWDSLAILSLIVTFDENFGKTVAGSDLKNCKKVEDILHLIEK